MAGRIKCLKHVVKELVGEVKNEEEFKGGYSKEQTFILNI